MYKHGTRDSWNVHPLPTTTKVAQKLNQTDSFYMNFDVKIIFKSEHLEAFIRIKTRTY